jgi:hypothetical protein
MDEKGMLRARPHFVLCKREREREIKRERKERERGRERERKRDVEYGCFRFF